MRQFRDKNGRLVTPHGERFSAEYKHWVAMKKRCLYRRHPAYSRYGGAGISVCARWVESFPNFLADMGRRPTSQHTIDRIDGAKGYYPANCRWASRVEQGRNKRNNLLLTSRGITLTITEWAERLGTRDNTIYMRIRHGWPVSEAVSVPVRRRETHAAI